MITTPDRIGEAIAAIERGEQVDWKQINRLLALDMAQLGRQFVVEAILFQEEQYEHAVAALAGDQ
jgi:hypothetical protein